MRAPLRHPGPVPIRCRRAAVLLAVSVSLLLPACGRKGQKPVYPVHGQVLVQGRPVPQATVTFHPLGATGKDIRPSAQTDEQGYFNLSTYDAGDGAPEGQYAVTVTWPRSFAVRGSPEGESLPYNALPQRYANPATSQLAATVTQGQNELSPIQVKAR